ncbi:uncharacterized protein DUF2510 [Humibacillus xanthopallidus]|uniref:Uncharacterized protein DUF2510 n=2 Tax=Humibacillus xanthopallidus TaxID=412689 RepID=A0A543I385_9MICO|nr:DUF4041 domain-containing protein [Humibacillus xanthopallidus]TQM65052.1 uncharacterized protein DUF2510 [Humibacillus xanthopallidus]
MAGNTAAGWYPDPMRRFEHRYWDGGRWTEHVSSAGSQSVDPVEATVPEGGTPTSSSGHQVASGTSANDGGANSAPVAVVAGASIPLSEAAAHAATMKVTTFNAKRIASELQSEYAVLTREVARLQAILADLGALDMAARQRRIDEQRQTEEALRHQVAELRRQLSELDQQVIVNRDRLVLEEVGLFDFEHPAEASASLATELESFRSQIRQANKLGTAITATSNFTFNNSTAKGRTFVNQMSRIMLRAYNAEAENAVKTVKAGNLASAQKRLSTARDQIAKQGQMIDLSVTDHYHWLRLRELELASRHLQAVAAEKELDRERRAELREQRALEAEIKREKERLEKERTHYLNSIQRLRDSGDAQAADALQAELDRIDAEIAEADYRAANIRAGYVYVISNIGAFGEGVVKIGMTRRLEPMDRIRELGDASVPFTFDVHALFFSDDAVSIEAMLHREFAQQRLNKVNPRREFFRVRPEQVLEALTEHKVSVLEFTTHAAADDFRMSWPSGYSSDPMTR